MVAIADALREHRLVGIDTTTFIYYLENSTQFAAVARTVFAELERGSFKGVTSVLTIMELTVKPLHLADRISHVSMRRFLPITPISTSFRLTVRLHGGRQHYGPNIVCGQRMPFS